LRARACGLRLPGFGHVDPFEHRERSEWHHAGGDSLGFHDRRIGELRIRLERRHVR
jgi:hypothetical protein